MSRDFLEGNPNQHCLERQDKLKFGEDDRVYCANCANRLLKHRKRAIKKGYSWADKQVFSVEVFECSKGCGACLDKPHRCFHYRPRHDRTEEINNLRRSMSK